ncbi:phosphate ABC transporter substrate-binding protein [Candidatus Weimeria sp. HCP3S3_B5]|uniref:phosphate ABC transporter substrate-binding protein n=1 Tax=Candidatus Weimeria sp. HCP3S3_B5 TaxID=3438871 RepID=UPI003F8A1E20
MKKKLFSLLLLSALTVSTVLTGCGQGSTKKADASSDTGSKSSSNKAGGDLSGTVATDGSTSMEKVIGYLSEAFMQENPNVKVTYNPTGSGSGIEAVGKGSCDIGLASRDLTDDEKSSGLTQTTIAIDGIAMIVNPNNGVENLSMDQIAQIYTGKITNWKDVGGSDGKIVVIGREAASGTRDGFETITDTKEKCKYSQELTSTGDVIQTVAGNPNAIGYASLADLNDTVKSIKVDDVAPSEDTVKDGSYKIQRNFNLITKDGKELSAPAKAFFNYCTGSDAAAYVSKAGAVSK